MNYNQFKNLSCYEEFEIQSALMGISKIDVLKNIGHQIDNYYFFISNDGIFNWYDLNGNHIEDPGVLKELKEEYIPKNIIKCIIPDSVTDIGGDTFYGCYLLKEIVIPNGVINISAREFSYCISLTSITIPDSVTHIGYSLFSHCKSLKEITIPNNVTSIGVGAFFDCISLTLITIPNSVTDIGGDAFFACNALKQVIFKGRSLDEVKQMKNYPFGIKDDSIIKCEM